jgi:hypothetical protein
VDENDAKNQVLQDLKAAVEKSSAGVVHDREAWDELVAAQPSERSELLKELTAFSELWEYFDRQQLPLPKDIVEDLKDIETLTAEERITHFREINQRLLARVPHDNKDSKSRM